MTCTTKYYVCSIATLTRPARLLIGLACLAAGCAGTDQHVRDAHRVTYAELSGGERGAKAETLTRLPVIIHFRAGDQVPLELVLDSAWLELDVPPLSLRAKRDVYLLLRPDGGPLLSADGHRFEDSEDNYFAFGIAVERDEPTRLRLVLGVRPERKSAAPER